MSLLLMGGLPNNHGAHTAWWGEDSECTQIMARISFLTLYEGCCSEALCCFSAGWADLCCSPGSSSRLNPVCSAAAARPPSSLPHTHQLLHGGAAPQAGSATRLSLGSLAASRPRRREHPRSRGDAGRRGWPPGRGAGRKSRRGVGGGGAVQV